LALHGGQAVRVRTLLLGLQLHGGAVAAPRAVVARVAVAAPRAAADPNGNSGHNVNYGKNYHAFTWINYDTSRVTFAGNSGKVYC
jgi:hypothetical protein